MKVAILMPMYKVMDVACVASLVTFQALLHERKHKTKFMFTNGFNAAKARKALAKGVADDDEFKADYVVWLDSDHVYTLKAFNDLIDLMKEHKLPMLSGNYKMHGSEETAHGIWENEKFSHFKYEDLMKGTEDPVDCTVVGFGFLVMKRKFLVKMWRKYGEKLFILDAGSNMTEDVTFCRCVLENGDRVCFAPKVRVGHVETAVRI